MKLKSATNRSCLDQKQGDILEGLSCCHRRCSFQCQEIFLHCQSTTSFRNIYQHDAVVPFHRHTNPKPQWKSKVTAFTRPPTELSNFERFKIHGQKHIGMFAKTVQRLKLLWSTTAASDFIQQLDQAQPAEISWDTNTYVCAGANVEFGKSIYGLSQPKDGLWACHCGFENFLKHVQGPHPFKYLTCGACEHIMCKYCTTTAILTRVGNEEISGEANTWAKGKEVRCCRICQYCGLSHRAVRQGGAFVFPDTPCRCGHWPSKTDQPYHIGSVENYRMDPARQAVALSLKRREIISQDLTPINRSQTCAPMRKPLPLSTCVPKRKPLPPSACAHVIDRNELLAQEVTACADPALKRRGAIRRRPAD